MPISSGAPSKPTFEWTNPADADLDGVVIVVRPGSVDWAPVAGATYNAGDDLGDGHRVLFAAAGDAVSVPNPLIGPDMQFAAWAYDTSLNYSVESATDTDRRLAIGAQTATLTYDHAAGTVTVSGQPDDISLAVAITLADETNAQIEVTAANDTGRILFNLKAIVDSVTNATSDNDPLVVDNDLPYLYFGPEGLDSGAAVARTLSLTDISDTTVTIDLRFEDAPMIFGGNYGGDFTGVDTSGSGQTFSGDITDDETMAGDNVREAVITRDGRYIIGGEKHSTVLTIVDTTTLALVGGSDLDTRGTGVGSVGGVALSDDGEWLFALYNNGVHFHGLPGDSGADAIEHDVQLIVFDTATWTEQSRVDIRGADTTNLSGRSLDYANGMLMACVSNQDSTQNEVWFYDVAAEAFIDADASTTDPDPVALTAPGAAEYCGFASDGAVAIVGHNEYRHGGDQEVDISLIDTTSWTLSTITPNTGGSSAGVFDVWENTLFYTGRQGEVASPAVVIDLDTLAQSDPSTTGTSGEATGVLVEPSGERYWIIDNSEAFPFDSSHAHLDLDGDGTGDTIDSDEQIRAHFMQITPF